MRNAYIFIPGLRLADKRSLPCPHRNEWLAARDSLYEEIMEKAWNKDLKHFGQSYEDNDVLDSAVLIMPLVFFIQPVRSHRPLSLWDDCLINTYPERPPIHEHLEADYEDAGAGRLDFECELSSPLALSMP
jgi:hypothetical protein